MYGSHCAERQRRSLHQPMLEAQRENARGEVLDLLTGHPVPDVAPVLERFQGILDTLEAQEDEGDISGLADEIAEWAPHRSAATQRLTDDALLQYLGLITPKSAQAT
jgi:hypothetical protein